MALTLVHIIIAWQERGPIIDVIIVQIVVIVGQFIIGKFIAVVSVIIWRNWLVPLAVMPPQ